MGGSWRPQTSDDWLDILRNATTALRGNPSDGEARAARADARAHLTPRVLAAFDNEARGQRRDIQEAQPSKAESFGMGASQGASFGLGEEGAGVFGALTNRQRGEGFQQSYLRHRDENRAYNDATDAAHPGYHLAGDLAGTFAPGLIAGAVKAAPLAVTRGVLTRLAPRGARVALETASQLGATTAQKGAGLLAAMRTAALYGGAHGYGRGEEGPIADLEPAAKSALASAILAGPLAILGRRGVAGSSMTAQAERKAMAETASAEANAQAAPYRAQTAEATAGRQAGTTALQEGRIAEIEPRAAVQRARAANAPAQEARAARGAERAEESHGQRMENARQATPRPVQGQMGPSQAEAVAAEEAANAKPVIGSPEWKAAKEAELRAVRPGTATEYNFRSNEAPVAPATPEQQAMREAVERAAKPQAPRAATDATMARIQRGASSGQLGYRQGQIASRFLGSAPTDQSATAVRALFANMPVKARGKALEAFLRSYGEQVDPGWEPILQALRDLP